MAFATPSFKTPAFYSTAQVFNTTISYGIGMLLCNSAASGLIFTNAVVEANGSGVLKGVHIFTTSSAITPALIVYLFRQAVSTQTNNTALGLTAAERISKSIGYVSVLSTDYISSTNCSEAFVEVTRVIKAAGDQSNIYALVASNATNSFTATNMVTLGLAIGQDP